jgi:uncharacterized protein YdhG (YjbR/CyaY superfamily)
MFWSGVDFAEEKLNVRGEKFKEASIFYNNISDINIKDLKRWLLKSKEIQWDYKNIVKRKGVLEPLKGLESQNKSKKLSPYGPKKFSSIDDYHLTFPKDVQIILQKLRKQIKKTAPKAEELISYNMPAFKLHSVPVYYAAYKEHIGFYPTPSPIKFFKEDLKKYKTSKGAIQFPLNEPLPMALIKK